MGVVVVMNLVPNRTIDPWGVFNPHRLGLIILILGGIEFASYIVSQLVGHKRSVLVVGFLGGLVSSTAVTLSSARKSALSPEAWKTSLCATLAAQIAALVELSFILIIIAPEILLNLAAPLTVTLTAGVLILLMLYRKTANTAPHMSLQSPLNWHGVLRLSLLFTALLGAISVVKLLLGEHYVLFMAILTGFFELHGLTWVTGTLFSQAQLSMTSATQTLGAALSASLMAKVIISALIQRGPFTKALATIVLVMLFLFWGSFLI